MRAGATIIDPNRFDVRGTVIIGMDVSFDINQWEKEGVSPDGIGKAARFMQINALTVDKNDNLLIGEKSRVRKVTPAGEVTTLAGNKTSDWRDAVGAKAMFRNIGGLCIDSKGNILVSDQFCIRKMVKQ